MELPDSIIVQKIVLYTLAESMEGPPRKHSR